MSIFPNEEYRIMETTMGIDGFLDKFIIKQISYDWFESVYCNKSLFFP